MRQHEASTGVFVQLTIRLSSIISDIIIISGISLERILFHDFQSSPKA